MTASETHLQALKEKITNRTAIVGVVGLGYVGLPFAVEKAKVGFRVIGVEQNPRRAELVNRGKATSPTCPPRSSKRWWTKASSGRKRALTGWRRWT